MASVMNLAAAERADLADLLESLTLEQWQAPSLCGDWTVREVVAHMVSWDALGYRDTVTLLGRNRLSINRANPAGVKAYAGMSPAALVGLFRAHPRPRGLSAVFGGRIGLTDGLIHHQDIRRALGLPREIPPERLAAVLGFLPRALPLPSRRDVRGLRLAATDLDWVSGQGPEVSGPGEALLMTIAGREPALADLAGPGVPVLTERLTARLSST